MDGITLTRALLLILVSLTGMRVIARTPQGWTVAFSPCWLTARKHLIRTCELHAAAQALSFLAAPPPAPVSLRKLGRYPTLHPLLRGVPFITYLTCDNHYQAYLKDHDPRHLRLMAPFLCSAPRPRMRLSGPQLYSVFYWWYSLKTYYARRFPYLFAPAPQTLSPSDMDDNAHAMLRALTGGDILKKQAVCSLDTYDALRELNEKAREAQELKRRIKK